MLPKSFFNRSSVLVAQDLLGKILVRKLNGKVQKFKIIETEAYEGLDDKASHASRGKTLRNAPMFAEAGTIYVYFTYGIHYMLNIVCGPKGHPSAVLIRGIALLNNSSSLASLGPSLTTREGKNHKQKQLNLIGPARLTKYLEIDKTLNNKKLGKSSGLWIESPKLKIGNSKLKIIRTPRIGIDSSGPIWSQKLLRFVLVEK